MPAPIVRYFTTDHLPDHLAGVSQPFADLAGQIDRDIPDSAEKSAGLLKLLEAKDCTVRAALDTPKEFQPVRAGGGRR